MNSLNSFQIVDIVHPRNRISLHIGQWWQEEDTRQEHGMMHTLCNIEAYVLLTYHEHIYVDLSKAKSSKNRCCAILSRWRGLLCAKQIEVCTSVIIISGRHRDYNRQTLWREEKEKEGRCPCNVNNFWILIKLSLFAAWYLFSGYDRSSS